MKRQIVKALAVVLTIIAFTSVLLVWASSTSHFIFTQNLELQNIVTKGPDYFQNGPAYQTINTMTYSGEAAGQVIVTVGPPYANSSEIPVLLEVTQEPNFRLDSVEVSFSSSVHNKLTYQPDFFIKPAIEADSQLTGVYASPYPYADEVTVVAKNLNVDNQGKFYQELVFSPTNPDLSKPLELNFNMSITMHENTLIQLTSLKLESKLALNASALNP